MLALLALATSAPGAGAAETPPDGLILWLDAEDDATLKLDGDAVSSWTSKAEPGHTFSAEGESRPQLVRLHGVGPAAAARFDGRDDMLRCLTFGHQSPTWTLIARVAPLVPASGAIVSACPPDGNDYDPGFTADLWGAGRAFGYLSVEGAGRVGGRLNQRTRADACGGFHVVVVTREPDRVRLWVDGVEEQSRPATAAITAMDELRVGVRLYDGREREPFHGDIAEVLLYDHVLSEEERSAAVGGRMCSHGEITRGEERARKLWEEHLAMRMSAPVVAQRWPSIPAYVAARTRGEVTDGPALPVDVLPIRTDILEAIRLGMHCLNSSFDRDRDGEPFFYSNSRGDGTAEFLHAIEIGIPHVVGRCLLGNMAASRATGIAFPPDGLAVLTRFCKRSFDNPDDLNSYLDPRLNGERKVEFHNMREGLYGLWALMFTPEREWALREAHLMLETLDGITDASGRWSPELLARAGMADRCSGLAVPNAARMVDALLAVHAETGDPLALKLARCYATAGVEDMFTAEGDFAAMERSSGHVHSITSSLSGITAYAIAAGDSEMLTACWRIMAVGVPDYFSSWGWGDEVYPDHPADEPSRGEINQTGDVIRTALLLGSAGYPEYYETAERFVRSMLLPTQHREADLRRFLHDDPDPASDAERDVIARSIGGYSMQLPNDRMQPGGWPIQTQDITSGAVHALAECWRHRVTVADGTARVDLLFDYDGPEVSVRSHLPLVGRIEVRALCPIRARVRIPQWVAPASLRLLVRGAEQEAPVAGGYVATGLLNAGDEAVLTFDVPCRRERETVDSVDYATTWFGNQIVDIRPRGTVSPLPF